MEPSVLYSLVEPTRQLPSECASNAVCIAIEKQYALKGIEIDLDEKALDDEVRKFYGKEERTGVSQIRIFDYIKSNGVRDKKGKRWSIQGWGRSTKHAIKTYLFERGVVNVSRRSASLRIRKGIATIKSINENKSHAVVCFGYDHEKGWLFVDSSHKTPYYLSDEDFSKLYLGSYYVIV